MGTRAVETITLKYTLIGYLSTDDSKSGLVHCRRLCLVSGIIVFKRLGGLWGREAENAILYLYRKALILASELVRPKGTSGT